MEKRKFFKIFLQEEEETNEIEILYGSLLISIIICFVLEWIEIDHGPYLLIGCLHLGLIGLLYYTRSNQLVGNLFLSIWAIGLAHLSFSTGGLYSMDVLCLAFIPIGAITLIDHKSCIVWFVFYIAFITYLWVVIDTPELESYYRTQTLVFGKLYYTFGSFVLATLMTGIVSLFYFQNRDLVEKLKAKEVIQKVHISQLKKQSILLEKTQVDLKRSNLELEEFAHVTSHDLKQPLSTINSFANLLQSHLKRKEIDDKQSLEMLQFIVAGSNKMQSLITDLLDFAKLKKESEIFYIKTNLNVLLEQVLADLKDQIDQNSVTIKKGDLPNLNVIPVKGNQLFQNLISNAIKFRKKEEPLVIQIGAVEQTNHWEFFIKDNGIGIDETHQDSIFEPFKKLHHSSQYSGSGIGLATCLHIVGLHKGVIRLESVEGKGSTFYFTIQKDLPTNSTEL